MGKSAPNLVLEVKNLTKKFPSSAKASEGRGYFLAVDNVSFSLAEGQILGFLGPNGAGKSTTINCILGVIEKDDGQIRMFGEDLASSRPRLMRNVNYCSAEYLLPWNLTLAEILLVYSKFYEVSNPKKRIDEVLAELNMGDLRNKLIRNMSFGQRARASLCKALINSPKMLLLDEPMASMDPDVVDKGISLIKKIQRERKITILYTSHNMWEIEQVANNVIFINHGKIIAQGSPLELTKQELKLEAKEPNLREVFIHLSRKKASSEVENEFN